MRRNGHRATDLATWAHAGGVFAAVLLMVAMTLVPDAVSGQVAGLGGSVTPAFQSPVTVGDQNQPALIQLVNGATGPQAATETLTVTNIELNPSCQDSTNQPNPVGPSPCTIGTSEPRPNPALPVLSLSATSEPTTTCPGGPFTISGPDAEGDYTFTPTTGPVTLAPVAQPGSSCVITFTFNVTQRPNDGDTDVFARALFTSPTLGPAEQTGRTRVVVNQATPTLTTAASTNSTTVPVGTTVTDQATVTGVANAPAPTGTVTYTLAGPNPDVNCTTPTVAPNGPATVAIGSPSPGYKVTAPGTYNFVATYSGDVNYAPITTPVGCGVPGEQFAAVLRTLTLTTSASTNATDVPPGTAVTDTATLTPTIAGGPAPTGTVTYTLVGPNPDANCTGPIVGTSSVGAGSASGTFTPTLPGTYNFVATYSGDANYAAVTTPVGCGVPAERFAIPRQPVQLTTQASTNSTTVAPGTAVTDTATLTEPAGFPAPTGTVTYTLVGPNPNGTCTAPVVGTPSTAAVGSPSGSYTVTTPGTYNFVATYSGDANYLPITTPVGCGVPGERFTVATLPIGLTTHASTNAPNVAPGTAVTDTGTFTPPAGGPAPTGTVTYTLVGPNPNGTCTAPVVGTPSTTAVGSPSASYTVTAPGTYNFVATYSGDANYSPITTPVGCGDPNEIFTVARQPASLTTQASTNSTSVAAGTAVTDTATFTTPAGAPAPTGTVTYTLVGPNPDVACTAPVAGTSTVPVGSPSSPFTVTSPGTYNFVATYSGDGFYAPITSPVGCGVPAERFTVAQQAVTLTTQSSTNSTTAAPGTAVTDLATVTAPAGGPAPTGTVTYTLVGPNPNATCTAPVVGTSTMPVGQPSGSFTVSAVGTYNFVATYSGDANYLPITTPVGCGVPSEMFAVALRPLGLTTQASTNSPTVAPGTAVTDTATFTPPAGGPAPTGTVTYTLVGPNPNVTCTSPVFGTPSTVALGTASAAFSPTAPGTYNFVATYSGDANYAPITTPVGCGDPNERFSITRASPTLVTTASSGSVGSQVFDTATLSGGASPTGTVTFQLFGPDNATCTGTPIFTSVKPVTGNGNVVSDSFVVSSPGVYRFVATYSGDANNNPAGPTACGDVNEAVGAGRAGISLSTQASGTGPVGSPIFDTATISGAFNPTGTVTFTLFGPDNATCTGTPIFTSVKTVNGNGSYPSDSFTPTQPGVYRWIANYSGDANNAGGVTPCTDPAEQTTVTPLPTIAITKAATPPSLPVPGGTFTFDLVVTNTSNVPLTIRSLTDNVYGDVTKIPGSTCDTAIGTVLAASPGPGNTYSCRFQGDFRGPAGASQTDTVTVTATDQRGNTVHASANATVTITPVPPSITTTKSAAPPSLQEPGGTFTFSYSVTNTGPEPVTVTSIVDNVYGDLNGRGTCATGARLAPNGGTYSCMFTGSFFGEAGATQTDTITTVARNDRGQEVTSMASATVTLTNVPPSIQIIKTPDPTSRPEPGGSFRFTVTVTNTSFEPITTTSLVDNIYGDLNGRGSCAIGVVLAPNGGTYTCAFDGNFFGKAGDSQTDTVTVVAVDHQNTPVTAKASATVTLTPVGTPPVTTPPVTTPPVTTPPPAVTPVVVTSPTPVQQALVRTGSDVARHLRLAGLFLLVGMALVGASWGRLGPGGTGLVPIPSGPGGGPRPSGDGGGLRFDAGNPFRPRPSPPPFRPPAGDHVDDRAEDGPAEDPPPLPGVGAAWAWEATVLTPVPPPAPPASDPGTEPAAEPVVLTPTVMRVRAGNGLDAAALDAMEAMRPAPPAPPSPPAAPGRRPRPFGGR